MLHKIRRGMRDRDSEYHLKGIVEIDDSFFGAPGGKRDRGSAKTPVIVKASIDGEHVRYAKMTVVNRIDGASVKKIISADIHQKQTIKTDGFKAYEVIGNTDHIHQRSILRGRKAHEVMKWSHILISNAKAFIQGTFHGIRQKHLHAYLNEFCYRFNRRVWELRLFDRLVTAFVNSHGVTYAELTK